MKSRFQTKQNTKIKEMSEKRYNLMCKIFFLFFCLYKLRFTTYTTPYKKHRKIKNILILFFKTLSVFYSIWMQTSKERVQEKEESKKRKSPREEARRVQGKKVQEKEDS